MSNLEVIRSKFHDFQNYTVHFVDHYYDYQSSIKWRYFLSKYQLQTKWIDDRINSLKNYIQNYIDTDPIR